MKGVGWWCGCGFQNLAEYGLVLLLIVRRAGAEGRTGQSQEPGAWSYNSQMNPVLIVSYRPGIS